MEIIRHFNPLNYTNYHILNTKEFTFVKFTNLIPDDTKITLHLKVKLSKLFHFSKFSFEIAEKTKGLKGSAPILCPFLKPYQFNVSIYHKAAAFLLS